MAAAEQSAGLAAEALATTTSAPPPLTQYQPSDGDPEAWATEVPSEVLCTPAVTAVASPAQLVVAKAYLDQLERSQALPAERIAALRTAISGAEANKGKMAKLKTMAPSLEENAGAAKSPADAARLHALAEILKHPSEKS